MMERLDAIAVLQGMHKKEFSLQTFAESNGNYTAEWYHSERAEALQLAISVLEALERNRAKAAKIITAERICYAPYPLQDCKKCPYCGDYGCCQNRSMDKEIVEILTQAYLQGDDDEQEDADDEQEDADDENT